MGSTPVRPIVLGYYPEWQTGLVPAAIDFRLFTHLCHAFAVVRRNGALRFPDERQSRDLCARAHAASVKVLLSVGGADSGPAYARQTAGKDAVARLADQLTKEAAKRGYDGIDVDWEFPTNHAERDQMNALVAALRARLPVGGLLTMATPAENWSGKWFETAALLPYLDFANVMTYDFHGSWSDHSGYLAPLFASPADPSTKTENTVDGSIDYWLGQKRWPAEKLLLGIPLYGTGFRSAHWGDKPMGQFATGDGELSYNAISARIGKGWKRRVDNVAKTPALQNDDGTQLISYEDADSALLKGAYAKRRGLAGIFFWEISNDFDGTTNPLVVAARNGLR